MSLAMTRQHFMYSCRHTQTIPYQSRLVTFRKLWHFFFQICKILNFIKIKFDGDLSQSYIAGLCVYSARLLVMRILSITDISPSLFFSLLFVFVGNTLNGKLCLNYTIMMYV